MALQPGDLRGEQRARGHRGIALGFEIGDRLRGFAGEVLPTAFERRRGAHLEIGDPGVGGLEPPAFLLVAGDRQCQGPLRAVDGRGRIAHLLIEDDQRGAILQFSSAAATVPRKSVKQF